MGGVKWCTSPCVDFWGDYSFQNTDAMKPLAFPMQGIHAIVTLPTGRKTLLYKLTWNLSKNPWEGTSFSYTPSAKMLSCLDHLV